MVEINYFYVDVFPLFTGYILADQGYDVWLGNNRGNLYSRNHSSIPPTNKTFWDFRWVFKKKRNNS